VLLLCCLALFPLPVILLGQDYLLTLGTRILIYGLAAASLDLILGYGGMVSLGHAAFLGVGGYTVGILAFCGYEGRDLLSWPLALPGTENGLLVWPLAVALAMGFAALTGAVSLRTRGMHFIMITLAFAQMVYFFFSSLDSYGGSDGISLYGRNHLPLLDTGSDLQFYYLCLFCLGIFLGGGHRLVRSRFGRILQGCRQNELRLQVMGVATFRHRLLAYVLAGGAAGLAGVLLANQGEFVGPGMIHWTRSGEILVMVLLGGMGTLVGPVLGAATLLTLEEYLAMYTEHWMVFLGPFLILVVLFGRQGIYGMFHRSR